MKLSSLKYSLFPLCVTFGNLTVFILITLQSKKFICFSNNFEFKTQTEKPHIINPSKIILYFLYKTKLAHLFDQHCSDSEFTHHTVAPLHLEILDRGIIREFHEIITAILNGFHFHRILLTW